MVSTTPVVARTAAEISAATTHLVLWPGEADVALTDDLAQRAPLLRSVYVHATGTARPRPRHRSPELKEAEAVFRELVDALGAQSGPDRTDARPLAKRQRQTESPDGWSALRKLWPLLPGLPCLRGVTIHHSGPSPIDDEDRARVAAAIPFVRCAEDAKVLVVCGKQDAEWWRDTVQRASNLTVVAVAPHPDPYPDDEDIDLDVFAAQGEGAP